MKYGDKLNLILANELGTALYSDYFVLHKNNTLRNFDESMRIFHENGWDAVRMVLHDIEKEEKVKDIDTETLAGALRSRGYKVTKEAKGWGDPTGLPRNS